jgi:Zn-dependent metalloprotease
MASRPRKSSPKPGARKKLFDAFAVHVADARDKKTLNALRQERSNYRGFSMQGLAPSTMDAESAAKRILMQALESAHMPKFAAPKIGKVVSDFKSLGVETVALTGTRVVKFRQTLDSIPIYGSLVSVELDENNECISINSNMAKPDVPSHTARISQLEALKTVAKTAGYRKDLPSVTPELNFYADAEGKWHLAFIFPNVKDGPDHRENIKASPAHYHHQPLKDYVVDALTGKVIAALPRTPSLSTTMISAKDELGASRKIGVIVERGKRRLTDLSLNIETYDFKFRDPEKDNAKLPGTIIVEPPSFSPAAVSAHANASEVARFMRQVLMRNNIDNKGGRLISVINNVVAADSPDGKQWFNAFWDSKQMVYGQVLYESKLRSLAASLDVVAHEFFHGVTEQTARLVYELESGAMNESYSDIFGTIISNFSEADVAKWNWLVGDGLSSEMEAFRSMKNPEEFGQPKNMKDYRRSPNTPSGDWGGVHTNSGIHNFAAYHVMVAKAGGKTLFKATEVAAIFYIAISQQLSRQSTFSDSRRGCLIAAQSLFRKMSATEVRKRTKAIEAAFNKAGIK